MPEKYGVYAQLVKSIAGTPVPTDTSVVFIGACAGGDLNKAYTITSMADYAATLGGALGDGYNLTEAAITAFQIAGIDKVYMIPVSHSLEFAAADYIGDGISTGAGAIVRFLARAPKTVVLVCAPSVTDSSVLAALITACKKADGHWDSMLVYDSDIPAEAVNENDVFVDSSEVSKALSDEQAICCLGRAKVTGNYIVSMAALRACLMARSDAGYGVPARSGGNLAMPGVIAWGNSTHYDAVAASATATLTGGGTATFTAKNAGADGNKISVTVTLSGLGTPVITTYVDDVSVDEHTITGTSSYSNDYITASVSGSWNVQATPGKVPLEGGADARDVFSPIDIPEAKSTELSSNGICAVIHYSGEYYTWCDHTSAFSNESVADERARYDSNMRILLLLTNRFQLKYRFSVDDPMTLTVRNDIIQEENDYLAYLKSIGAIIGDAECRFVANDNPADNIALGQFVWSIVATVTPPMKYAQLNVAYSQAGLSVYYQ